MKNYYRNQVYRKRALAKPTHTESELWSYLNQWKTGYRFIRQKIIDNFRVDFASWDLRLIIEIDGGYHDTPEQQERDRLREDMIKNKGWEFIRFTNDEIKNDCYAIALEITRVCDEIAEERGVKILWERAGSPCGRHYKVK